VTDARRLETEERRRDARARTRASQAIRISATKGMRAIVTSTA
jgi:hypothetical protein